MEQDLRFCTAPGGVRLAYATLGQGPPLVMAASWLGHLEHDLESPVWRHWLRELTRHHTLVRYDECGCGLSDWDVDNFSVETWVQDLETVVDALGLARFPLLGLSHGGPIALAYAERHPEKVSHLILLGGYARGLLKHTTSSKQVEQAMALLEMVKFGWGRDNPAFRQVFTTMSMPEATEEQKRWLNEFQRTSTSPENAARFLAAFYAIDVTDLAPRVTVPTLLLHVREDAAIPFRAGRELAALMPAARFVPLEGKNHLLLEDEPAWPRFLVEVRRFLGVDTTEPAAHALDTGRWDQLSALFKRAVALPPDQREALLDRACADDPTLRRQLESFLDADAETGLTKDLDDALHDALASWAGTTAIHEGQTIAHYQIQEKLGAGGMGLVYKARDTKLDRTVALKFLPRHLSAHEEVKQRFIHEAKAASALDHTNICTIYEIGETDTGRLFIAMACYRGETLKEKIAQGPLAVDEAVGYAVQMAEGLAQAHERGIVHRDVKPANVMVTDRGRVKLLDFGIAKVADAGLTKTGSTLGTPAYMSPEQTRGEAVDGRTDVWSLGVVLYEMLTGRRPFRGDYEQAVIYSILHEDPEPLATARPEAPAALVSLVEKALSKDPEDRHPQMTHLLHDLKRLRPNETTLPPTPAPAWGRLSKRQWAGLTALFVLLLLGSLWMVAPFRPAPAAEAGAPDAAIALAVLPFSVSAGDALGYLDEGMVDLLSTKLDGAGALRSVDPRALLGYVNRGPRDDLNPDQGVAIARRFNADLFVLGKVVGVADQVQLTASLYETGGTPVLLGEGTAQGDAADLFDLVDDLAAQLLINVEGGPGARVRRLAGVTTASLSAYKAYLDGERAFRAGRYEAAVEAFQRAVAQDSLFALAYYRLSIAAEWHGRANLTQEAAEQAFRHAGRLSEHDQRLLEGFLFWRRGAYAEAERKYRSIVASYPDDVEAWIHLAEVLFHTNPFRGRSFTESRAPYERVLSYEPEDVGVLLHLARVAAIEGQRDELDRLVDRILTLSPSGDRTLEMNALRAFAHANRAEEERVVAMAEQAGDQAVVFAAWDVPVYSQHPERTEALVRRLAAPWRSPEAQALAYTWLAHLHLLRGRWQAAQEALTALERLDPVTALEYRALFASLPFAPTRREALHTLRDALARIDTAAIRPTDNPSIFFNAHNEVHPILIPYLSGLLDVQLGDTLAAAAHAAALDRLQAHPRTGTLAPDLARSLRSHLHHTQGRPAEALTTIEETRLEIWYPLTMASPFYAQARERFLRAELLFELGRYQEAIGWYRSVAQVCPGELAYVPVSELRLGEIYERLNDSEAAVIHYARFVALWKDGDPELQPMVEAAKERLDELRAI